MTTRLTADEIVSFVLGASLGLPMMVHWTLGEEYGIAVGSILFALVSFGYLVGNLPSMRAFGRGMPQLLLTFVAIGSVSVLVGTLRYGNMSGILSFTFQIMLMAQVAVGYSLLRTAGAIAAFLRGMVLVTGTFTLGLITYLISTGEYANVAVTHNDRALMTTIHGWPNAFGCFLAIAMMFALALFTVSRTKGGKCAYAWWVAVLGSGIILTFSRTAYVVTVFAVAIWLFKSDRRVLTRVMLAGLLIVPAAAAVETLPLLESQVTAFDSAYARQVYMEDLFSEISAPDLLLGHGYQNVHMITRHRLSDVVVPGLTFEEMTTHNEYITILLKTGLGGAAIFGVLLLMVLRDTGRIARAHHDPFIRTVFAHWQCVLLPLYSALMTLEGLRYWAIGVTFWILAGSVLRMTRVGSRLERGRGSELRNGTAIAVGRIVQPSPIWTAQKHQPAQAIARGRRRPGL